MNRIRKHTPIRPLAIEDHNRTNLPSPGTPAARLDPQTGDMRSVANKPGIEWLTKREVAVHFKCSVRHINSLMKRRVLPYVKMGRFVRFDVAACDLSIKRIQIKSVLG
jgi:hypothetical protein